VRASAGRAAAGWAPAGRAAAVSASAGGGASALSGWAACSPWIGWSASSMLSATLLILQGRGTGLVWEERHLAAGHSWSRVAAPTRTTGNFSTYRDITL